MCWFVHAVYTEEEDEHQSINRIYYIWISVYMNVRLEQNVDL